MSSNEIHTFSDAQFGNLRTAIIDGEPWFVAADACRALNLTGYPSKHTVKLDADEKLVLAISDIPNGRDAGIAHYKAPNVTLISESGLYKLIMRSDKPQARPFQDWVTKTVLPSIRKDGMYVMGEEKVAAGELSEDEFILTAYAMLQRKVERLTAERDHFKAEVEIVTVNEYLALKHLYATHSLRTTLGKRAAKVAQQRGVTLDKQDRYLPVQDRWTVINVYPKAILDEAFATL